MNYKKHTLKNGLRVILVPVPEMTTATALICVGTGSRYEDERENGLAHFLEHMFFKGTKRRPKAGDISSELDALGSSHNAYTGKDHTGYYAKVAAGNIMPALDILTDLFCHATFKASEITKESGAILQEINMYEDMPSRAIYDTFEALLYGADHPLGREILGPKSNITAFRRKDFLAYRDRCYSARNTVVCVAGSFPQGKVLAHIRKVCGSLGAGEKPAYELYQSEQVSPQLVVKQKQTDQTHLLLGVKTFGFEHKDRYALSVLAAILGGGMSSRLWHEVREKRGLAYHVSATTELFHETGALIVQAGVEHANLQKTMAIILKEMQKIASKGVAADEFKRAKAGFAGRLAFGYETSDSIASHFAQQEVIKDHIMLPEETLKSIKKVTRRDVQRVAKAIFTNDCLNCAIIGPHEKKENVLRKLLKF